MSGTIDRKKEQRFQFLHRLYELTGGNEDKKFSFNKIGEELGFDKDLAWNIAQYLESERLVEIKGVPDGTSITHYGVRMIEEALSNPNKLTYYFPPANFIYVDRMINSHIQQASPGATQVYSCFISYSSKDQEFAERLHADLQNKGVRCWFAPEDLKIGDKFRTRIDESIQVHDKLLLVLSRHSVISDWVEKEVETALERERKEKCTVLFPIQLDNAVMEIENGWPADVRRTRHIGDFQRWKNPDEYQKAFDRLLRDLKADKFIDY